MFSDTVGATVTYEYTPKTFGGFQTRGAKTFQKSSSYIYILGTGRVTRTKFQTEETQNFVIV